MLIRKAGGGAHNSNLLQSAATKNGKENFQKSNERSLPERHIQLKFLPCIAQANRPIVQQIKTPANLNFSFSFHHGHV